MRALRRALIAGLVVVPVLLVGCTAAPQPRPTPSATPASVRFVPAGDPRTPELIAGPTTVERAIQASRALFAAAPGVILVPDRDVSAQRTAAEAAARLHVPVLLLPALAVATPAPSPSASGSPMPVPSASATVAQPSPELLAEVRRLGARWIATVGAAPPAVPGVRRIALGAAATPAAPPPPPTVVVASSTSSDAAAIATARAAGATVVPTTSAELTATGAVVTALAKAKRSRVVLLGSAFATAKDTTWAVAAARTGFQYPGGGQRPFTGRLFVALYGTPGAPVLGVLGQQDPTATIARVKALAKQYDPLVQQPVVPALEVIATVASGSPTPNGDYSGELDVSALEPYVDRATKAGIPVILDLQPGRADFLTQAKEYQSLLERPMVGLALDPEWRLGPKQKPLVQIGSVSADEVNRTSAWLAGLVRDHGLPPKMFVLHQFRSDMLRDRSAIVVDHPELDTLIHVDGQGGQPDKQATWRTIRAGAPAVGWGWKNFLVKDHPVLTPAQTIAQVHPTPDLITYQ